MTNKKQELHCVLCLHQTPNGDSLPLPPHQVTFSSLDVHLHTEALLNTMNFLNNLLPPSTKKEGGQEELPTIPEEDETEAEREGQKKEESLVTKKKSN